MPKVKRTREELEKQLKEAKELFKLSKLCIQEHKKTLHIEVKKNKRLRDKCFRLEKSLSK